VVNIENPARILSDFEGYGKIICVVGEILSLTLETVFNPDVIKCPRQLAWRRLPKKY